MRKRLEFSILLVLAVVPSALALATWYVDGVDGNDYNDCTTRQTACKTIGHAAEDRPTW